MAECNNKSNCHNPLILEEDRDAMRVICNICYHQYIIRKRPIEDVPENRQYSKIFKKDILQGSDNLFYKYNPQYIRK